MNKDMPAALTAHCTLVLRGCSSPPASASHCPCQDGQRVPGHHPPCSAAIADGHGAGGPRLDGRRKILPILSSETAVTVRFEGGLHVGRSPAHFRTQGGQKTVGRPPFLRTSAGLGSRPGKSARCWICQAGKNRSLPLCGILWYEMRKV